MNFLVDRRLPRRMIACVASSEIFDVLKNGRPYQEPRYLAALWAAFVMPAGKKDKDDN